MSPRFSLEIHQLTLIGKSRHWRCVLGPTKGRAMIEGA